MHSSAKLQSPLLSVPFFCSCDKIYRKQEVRFFVFTLFHWIKIDRVLLKLFMIDIWETVHWFFCFITGTNTFTHYTPMFML